MYDEKEVYPLRIADGYSINGHELFIDYDYRKRLKGDYRTYYYLYHSNKIRRTLARIFLKSVELIVKDIVYNNVTFSIPGKRYNGKLYIKRLSDEKFKKLRQKGLMLDVDILATNFSGYQMVLETGTRHIQSHRIYIPRKLTDKITENINNGKFYF